MPCSWTTLPDGTRVHIKYGRGRPKKCRTCGRMTARLECDGCDQVLCHECSVQPFADHGDGVDLCPSCAKPAFTDWRDNHGGASAYAVLGRDKARDEFRAFVKADPRRFVEQLVDQVRWRLDKELERRRSA